MPTAFLITLLMAFGEPAEPVPAAAAGVVCPLDDCTCYNNGESRSDDYGRFYWGYTCVCNTNHRYWVRSEASPKQKRKAGVTCPLDDCTCYNNGQSRNDDYGRFYWGYTCVCNPNHQYWVRS